MEWKCFYSPVGSSRMESMSGSHVQIDVENIGGIGEAEVEFEPGVTVLSGRNATNRTSFLEAIMAGLGSNRVSLKGDATRGSVTLRIGDKTYTRTLERQGNGITFDGDPYLDDPTLADLFAFLLESNEARRAVALEKDLRDIIMKPVDVEEIQEEIQQFQADKNDITDQIEERESLKRKLPELERRRDEIEADIEETAAKLSDKRATLEELSRDVDEVRTERSELTEKMEQLRERKSELDDTEFRLESQRESLESLRKELADLEERHDEIDDDLQDVASIRSEMSRLREKKQQLDIEMSKLQNLIQFNEDLLEGENREIASVLRGAETEREVTDELVEDDTLVCWTCGSTVERERIAQTVDSLRELRKQKYSRKAELDEQLSDLKEKRSTIEHRQQKRREVERRLQQTRSEIEERESKVEELESRRGELADRIADLESEIEALETNDQSQVLTAYRTVGELEAELERLESERDRIEGNIDEIEAEVEEIADLEAKRDRIQEKLEERRTRIERLERDAIETFNEQMDTALELLEYANIDRIWVERVEREVRDGRRKVTKPEFRLHIVRTTEDGVTYEDDFEHLSESEREVTGLVFSLAGYLAHDVHEIVPFMLLDSLEAIDSERIATLVQYLEEYAEFLVVALLPEDAEALDGTYQRMTEI